MPLIYNGTIPQPTDEPRNSQPLMLQNFASILSWVNVNHGTFASADYGQHELLSMPIRAVDPALLANGMQVYTKNGAISAAPELYVERANGTVLNCTEGSLIPGGWAHLPCGLMIKWGDTNVLAAGNGQVVAYPVGAGIQAFTAVFKVFLQNDSIADSNTISVRAVTATTFTVNTATGGQWQYFAIGI